MHTIFANDIELENSSSASGARHHDKQDAVIFKLVIIRNKLRPSYSMVNNNMVPHTHSLNKTFISCKTHSLLWYDIAI